MLTQQGYRQLFFYSYHTCTGLHYHVSVCSKNEAPAIYVLKSKDGRWTLEDPGNCPEWLQALEEELNEAIQNCQVT